MVTLYFALAEDILKSGHAVWVAPDGAGIVYATFDDSKVEEVQFEVYGQEEGSDDPYPGLSSMRYPKVSEMREGSHASLPQTFLNYPSTFICYIQGDHSECSKPPVD